MLESALSASTKRNRPFDYLRAGKNIPWAIFWDEIIPLASFTRDRMGRKARGEGRKTWNRHAMERATMMSKGFGWLSRSLRWFEAESRRKSLPTIPAFPSRSINFQGRRKLRSSCGGTNSEKTQTRQWSHRWRRMSAGRGRASDRVDFSLLVFASSAMLMLDEKKWFMSPPLGPRLARDFEWEMVRIAVCLLTVFVVVTPNVHELIRRKLLQLSWFRITVLTHKVLGFLDSDTFYWCRIHFHVFSLFFLSFRLVYSSPNTGRGACSLLFRWLPWAERSNDGHNYLRMEERKILYGGSFSFG